MPHLVWILCTQKAPHRCAECHLPPTVAGKNAGFLMSKMSSKVFVRAIRALRGGWGYETTVLPLWYPLVLLDLEWPDSDL